MQVSPSRPLQRLDRLLLPQLLQPVVSRLVSQFLGRHGDRAVHHGAGLVEDGAGVAGVCLAEFEGIGHDCSTLLFLGLVTLKSTYVVGSTVYPLRSTVCRRIILPSGSLPKAFSPIAVISRPLHSSRRCF